MHLDQLTDELIRFAKEELDVSEEELRSTETNEPLRQKLLDELLDIEGDEISAAGPDRLPAKRGQLAADLLTLLCYPAPEPEED